MSIRVKVHLMFEDIRGRFLVRKVKQDGKDHYVLPGGDLEFGTTPVETSVNICTNLLDTPLDFDSAEAIGVVNSVFTHQQKKFHEVCYVVAADFMEDAPYTEPPTLRRGDKLFKMEWVDRATLEKAVLYPKNFLKLQEV